MARPGAAIFGACTYKLVIREKQMPPGPQDVARRFLVLLAVHSHALRLMMLWDFTFRTAEAMTNLTGHTPSWRSLGLRGEWLKWRARWNWFGERRAMREVLRRLGLSSSLASQERQFLGLGLSETSRTEAGELGWQIEAAACLAWALRLLPCLWRPDEQFDGKLDFESFAAPERRLVETASLRPKEEIRAAAERLKLWHWRARQLQLERQGCLWPPADASPDQRADLPSKGLDSLDGVVRVTARLLKEAGTLDQVLDEDFVARGKPYRELTEAELSELLGIAAERHKALNWLCGMAPSNDWAAVPTET